MAERAADRVKATQLRQKTRRTPEQQRWLDEYTARTAITKARALPAASSAAQSTEAPSSSSDPSAFTWTPTVPPANDDAPVPAGAAPPPVPGTPLIGTVTPAPQGDPATAKQFAGIMMLIASAGLGAAMELLADKPLPPAVVGILAMFVGDAEKQQKAIAEVGVVAERVAIARGFRPLPYQDEIFLAGVAGGSALAVAAVMKRRATGKPSRPGANGVHEPEPEQPTSVEDATVPPPVPGMWQ